MIGLCNADISNLGSAGWRRSTAAQQTLALFSVCRVIYVQGEARGLGAVGSWGMEVGDWRGEGRKSALLVFDPGQRYTRGHGMTAAVHLAEAKPPPAPS